MRLAFAILMLLLAVAMPIVLYFMFDVSYIISNIIGLPVGLWSYWYICK